MTQKRSAPPPPKKKIVRHLRGYGEYKGAESAGSAEIRKSAKSAVYVRVVIEL